MAVMGPGMADRSSPDSRAVIPPPVMRVNHGRRLRSPAGSILSAGHGVPKAARGLGRELAEDVREVALIRQPYRPETFAYREVRAGQQCLGALDPRAQHVSVRRNSRGLTKLPMEMEAADAGDIGQVIEADRVADAFLHVSAYASQLVVR